MFRIRTWAALLVPALAVAALPAFAQDAPSRQTKVALDGTRWLINGEVTHPGAKAEGLLMNVRMVNTTFEDRGRPDFEPDANTAAFIKVIPEYYEAGVRAFTLNLQGGMPGYEGALNTAFEPDGSLRPSYLERVARVIDVCDQQGIVIILGYFYQRQDQVLLTEDAVRAAVVNATRWIKEQGYTNVLVEIANEFGHGGYDHNIIRSPEGQVELMALARKEHPGLLVSTSGLGSGRLPQPVIEGADFLMPHFNNTALEDIPDRIKALQGAGKAIVCNEDDKVGEEAAEALRLSVENGCGYGLMLAKKNQNVPFEFDGIADDPVFYAALKALTH